MCVHGVYENGNKNIAANMIFRDGQLKRVYVEVTFVQQ